MTHKKFNPPIDPVFIPLHVGRALGQELGYTGDDTGENISDLNPFYGELTGVYWVWNNYHDADNVGLCHYRRFFTDGKGGLLKEADFERILSEYDVITSISVNEGMKYYDYFGEAHNAHDLDLERGVIERLTPEYVPYFDAAMASDEHYFGNLMVCSKERFDDYCEWLFTIFSELSGELDLSGYDEYHRRIFGFLSEQLLKVWILKNGYKPYECPVGITDEKAETKELKAAVSALLLQGDVSGARKLFNDILRVRPDVRLPHSDLKAEIPVMELLLYIMETEKQRGLVGMYEYSNDLQTLIEHTKKLRELLKKFADTGKLDEEERRYIEKTNTTEVTLRVLCKNTPELTDKEEKLVKAFS